MSTTNRTVKNIQHVQGGINLGDGNQFFNGVPRETAAASREASQPSGQSSGNSLTNWLIAIGTVALAILALWTLLSN